jgi:hypothetical protein
MPRPSPRQLLVVGALSVVATAFTLGGCNGSANGPASGATPAPTSVAVLATSSGSATPATVTAAPATPTSSTAATSGGYVIRVIGNACQAASLQSRVLKVDGGTASVTNSAGTHLTGSVLTSGSTVKIKVLNNAPTKDQLDIDGTVDATGTVHGKGTYGGLHPGLTNGYSCQFDVTLEAIRTGVGDACTAAAIQAVVDAQAKEVTPLVEPQTLQCADGWAIGEERIDDGQNKRAVTFVAHSVNGEWSIASRDEACAQGHIPLKLRALACGSN